MVNKVKAAEIEWNDSSVGDFLKQFEKDTPSKRIILKNNLKLVPLNKIEFLIWKLVKKSNFLRRVLFSVDYPVAQKNLEKIKPLVQTPEQVKLYNAAIQTFNDLSQNTLSLLTPPKPSKDKRDSENPFFDLVEKWEKERITYDKLLSPIQVLHASQQCFRDNIPAYLKFLEETPKDDEIFITVGFGGVGENSRYDQLWPGPLRKAFAEKKKIQNIMIDTHGNSCSGFDISQAVTKLPNFTGEDWKTVQKNLDIKQFACGIPDDSDADEENFSWEKTQIQEFKQKWCQYNLKALEANKNVYIGWYINSRPFPWVIDFYNQNKDRFPDQLFLLVGSQDFGCIAKGQFNQNEVNTARYHTEPANLNSAFGNKYIFVENGNFANIQS